MPNGRDPKDLSVVSRNCERFIRCMNDRTPPGVRILFGGPALTRHLVRTFLTDQRTWRTAIYIRDQHLDGRAAKVNREKCAAFGSHCAAAARTARRFSVGRRCGRC
jgi:hypothetical protein